MHKLTVGRTVFNTLNYTLLAVMALLCTLPILHILAISFSSSAPATAGIVKLWPVQFTTKSYEYVLSKPEFFNSLWITVLRVVLGTALNMFLTILIAYPLSKESSVFKFRTLYAWIFVLTILFNGGLIPWYMTIKETGIMNTIWALIIPGAVPVFNIILLLNFFRGLPKELEEAAFIDGSGYWGTLWKIFVPLSLPAMATITLFTVVGHWNSWFDGLILMNSPSKYPLSSYLQTVIIQNKLTSLSGDEWKALSVVSDRTVKSAQIFLGALPILVLYPFLQKYFVKGIVLGSVKG